MRAIVTTDDTSPWFSGHFPGDPILPGIAQVAMVSEIIARWRQQSGSVKHLSRIKFRRPTRPGEPLTVEVCTATRQPDTYQFLITTGEEPVCSGMMSFH